MHERAVGFALATDAVGGVGAELTGPLDAQKVGLGLQLGLLDQEGALARADLQLEAALRVREPLTGVGPPGVGVGQNVFFFY